ncbi:MAG TPA: phage/plasmid primase, P4 family [Candidatus Paceibacterota bacterium]|nr:phage/plasmid primase, P4 family [Candidatus Paceibacterota bacterium]
MKAFHKFKRIDAREDIQKKHRAWLEDYEGMTYSIAEEGIHKVKWVKDPIKYVDANWQSSINCIKELKKRCRIEFDGDEKLAKEYLEQTQKKLKELKIGHIRSTHKGKSDYLWIEFNRNMTEKEKEAFLVWISPENAEVDLNFSSSRKVFPVLYAVHWKHSFERELPIEYFEGEKIDFDSLGIKIDEQKIKKLRKQTKSFEYVTGIKEASQIFTLEGQAERFNEIQPLFYDKSGMFWLWDNKEKCWKISDDIDILNMIQQTTGKDIISSKSRVEILNALKQKGRLNIPKQIKNTWVQFKNTIVDIQTGEEFKATPEYFVTNPIPYELHKERFIETPMMDKIFEEWVGEEYVKTLYEIIAYCLIPDYPIHRLFCFIGAGLNGKSCFLKLLKKFIGESNCTATELDILLSSRFEITRLHKKLVCIMGETNFSEMSKTSIIKKLTGQDIIGYEHKNKTPFEDENYAKILIATNNLPTTTDKTIGFYRRWLIIDFPTQFSEKKNILEEIPEEEYEILAVKSLGILKELLEKREFHNEGNIEQRMKKYEDHSDPLEKFLKEFTEEDVDGSIFKFDFEKKLNDWCKENRFRTLSEVAIGKKMKEKGFEQGKIYSNWLIEGQKKQLRAWLGLKIKESQRENPC